MRRVFHEVLALAFVSLLVVLASGVTVAVMVMLVSLLYWPESPFD